MRDKFIADYPFANLSQFEFWIGLEKNEDIDEENKKIVYVGDGEPLYDEFRTSYNSLELTSRVFKTLYSDALYWGPSKIWNPTTTKPKFAIGNGVLNFDPTNFKIFVNDEQRFVFKSEPFDIKWSGTGKDITKASVDKNDPYVCSLIAAYVISQKTGICTKHFQN